MGTLLCFVPLMLTSGSFLPDLTISILGILFIIITVKEKQWSYYRNNFFYFFIFFYLFFLLSSFLSNNLFHSLESSLFYFRFGIFALSIWFLLDHDKKLLKKFTMFFLFTFLVIIIDGYFQFLFDHSIFGFQSYSVNRLTLMFNDKMILGGYLIRLLPLLFGLLIYTNLLTEKTFIPATMLFILVFVLVVLSGERTALALLLLFGLMMMFLLSKFKFMRWSILLFSLISIILIFSIYPKTIQRSIYDTMVQLNVQDDFSNPNFFSITHEHLAITAINIFDKHKLIGSGPKQFRVLCNDEKYKAGQYSCSTHPHNNYLQLAAETGLIGILFLIIPLIFLMKKIIVHLFQKIRNKKIFFNDYEICILICILMTLWPILPTQNFFNNWINIIYYLPIGFLLHSVNKKYKL